MKKNIVGLFAAMAAAVSFGGRTISSVTVNGGVATVSLTGEGPDYATLVLAYGAAQGGQTAADWDCSQSLVVGNGQESVDVELPNGWGTEYTNAEFFLYDGIANRSDSYIRRDLVANWDAIDNAGFGQHANENVKVWKDLVSGYELVSSTAMTVGERSIKTSVADTANLDAETSAQLLDTGVYTLESMLSVVTPDSHLIFGTANSHIDWFNYSGNQHFIKDRCKGIPAAGELSTYSAVYDQSKSDAAKLTAAFRNGLDEWNSNINYWNGGKANLSFTSSGEFRTLRYYSRALTADELKLNAAIDRARYVGEGASEDVSAIWRFTAESSEGRVLVSVAASEYGETAGGGLIALGATVTLTATPAADCTFAGWMGLPDGVKADAATVSFTATKDLDVTPIFRGEVRPIGSAGRSIEVTAVEKDESGKAVSVTVALGAAGDGTDRIDTLYAAFGPVDVGEDIRYWPVVRPVRALLPTETSYKIALPEGWGTSLKALRFFYLDNVNADSYVKESLVAQWDGTDNVATGTHDPEATVWRDRVHGYEFALNNVIVGANSVTFKGKGETTSNAVLNDYDGAATFGAAQPRTVEFSFDTHQESCSCVVFVGPSSMLIAPYQSVTYFSQASLPLYATKLSTPAHQVALVYRADGSRQDVFVDGVTPETSGSGGWNLNVGNKAVLGASATGTYPSVAEIYAVRVYHAILTETERTLNRTVDAKIVAGEVTTGTAVSCSEALLADSDVKSQFVVSAEAFCGTVTGTGTFEEGTEVTVAVTMDPGCSFVRWTGNVPAGVDPTSASITFELEGDVSLVAEVSTPWRLVRDGEDVVTELRNGDWRFTATATEEGVTLVRRLAGEKATLDLTEVGRDTGLEVVAFGDNLFESLASLKHIVHPGNTLKRFGMLTFKSSGLVDFSPETLDGLESIGSSCFQSSKIKGLYTPALTNLGTYAFRESSITNAPKVELDFPLKEGAFYQTKSLNVPIVVNSPSTVIPTSFFEKTAATDITINSPVTAIEQFALCGLSNKAVIKWNVPAPTTISAYCGIGTYTEESGFMKLRIARDSDGWRALSCFVPIEEIDAAYKTRACGWESGAIGWIVTYNGAVPYRCWVIQKQGLLLIVK